MVTLIDKIESQLSQEGVTPFSMRILKETI